MNKRKYSLIKLPESRWLVLALAIFALHIIFILLLSKTPAPTTHLHKPFTIVMRDDLSIGADEFYDLNSPVLFAMADRRGFSGYAWLKLLKQNHNYYEFKDAPKWLSPFSDLLGNEISKLLTNIAITHNIGFHRLPEPEVQFSIQIQGPTPPTYTEIEFDEKLLARGIEFVPPLPTITHTDVIAATVTRVIVDSRGYVLSSAIISESGYKPADILALDLAKSVKFKPIDMGFDKNGSLTIGNITFKWYVQNPE